MFSNGKFKNTIASFEENEGLPLASGQALERRYPLALMENGGGRHWVALEDRYGRYVSFPSHSRVSPTLSKIVESKHVPAHPARLFVCFARASVE